VRRIVAGYVNEVLEKPHVRETRLIDVSRAIDHVWESLAPTPRGRAVGHNEDTFVSEPEGQ
jgi:hypothetical protein